MLGLDIGGANLKAATADGQAVSVPFALWQSPDRLAEELALLLAKFPRADSLAVTMTGELADCFATKAEGVDRILSAVESLPGRPAVHVWSTAGRFVSPSEARTQPHLVAAANWHAQATWGGRLVPQGNAVLIDIGSTTTDIIPLGDGVPCPIGLTDPVRLQTGELVYRGVRRTPLMALGRSLRTRGGEIPMAAEVFATTLDVFLLRDDIPEDPADCQTANGRPATKAAAHDRLARMACCDRTEFSFDDARRAARHLADQLTAEIASSLNRVVERMPSRCDAAIVSGSGDFLAGRIVERTLYIPPIALRDRWSPDVAESACAYAVAVLLAESRFRLPDGTSERFIGPALSNCHGHAEDRDNADR